MSEEHNEVTSLSPYAVLNDGVVHDPEPMSVEEQQKFIFKCVEVAPGLVSCSDDLIRVCDYYISFVTKHFTDQNMIIFAIRQFMSQTVWREQYDLNSEYCAKSSIWKNFLDGFEHKVS